MQRRTAAGTPLTGMDGIGWKEALIVGLAQAVALVPGSSRSGTTITGGLLVGLDRATAARFSFLLSLPSVLAAGVLELVREREHLLSSDVGALNLLVATAVSGVVGYASIAFLLDYLKRHTTYLFIVYRLIVGTALLALAASGVLPAN